MNIPLYIVPFKAQGSAERKRVLDTNIPLFAAQFEVQDSAEHKMSLLELFRKRRKEAKDALFSWRKKQIEEFHAHLAEKGWTIKGFEEWAEKTYPWDESCNDSDW